MVNRDNLVLNTENTHYDTSGTSITEDQAAKQLLGWTEPLKGRFVTLLSLGHTEIPDEITINSVTTTEKDEKTVDFRVEFNGDECTHVSLPESDGGHPLLVFRGDEYTHYRIGLYPV